MVFKSLADVLSSTGFPLEILTYTILVAFTVNSNLPLMETRITRTSQAQIDTNGPSKDRHCQVCANSQRLLTILLTVMMCLKPLIVLLNAKSGIVGSCLTTFQYYRRCSITEVSILARSLSLAQCCVEDSKLSNLPESVSLTRGLHTLHTRVAVLTSLCSNSGRSSGSDYAICS